MKIKTLKSAESEIKFVIDGVNFAFVNALRRAAGTKVPTLAIEDVYFIKNSSALYDEIMAHRLGLIPLHGDLKSYTLPAKCRCGGKGCARCQVKFTLKAVGPCVVYARDLKSGSPIKPVYPEMPIVELLKGQDIDLQAVAVLGEGSEHIKWSPGLAYYQSIPRIQIDAKKCNGCSICVEHCPKGVLEIKNKKAVVKDIWACNLCASCQDRCPRSAIKIEGSEEEFIFTLESWGQLTPSQILVKAADILNSQLKEVKIK